MLRPILIFSLAVVVQTFVAAGSPAFAEGEPAAATKPTEGAIMRALAILPPECWLYQTKPQTCTAVGHYERLKNAPVMAKAIVAHARDLEEAVTIAAWSVWEANMVTTALGDHGKSVGPLQLQAHVLPAEKAVDPEQAVVAWLNLKHRAEVECARNPESERLALIASGNCFMGRMKVAHRAGAVSRVLATLQHGEERAETP